MSRGMRFAVLALLSVCASSALGQIGRIDTVGGTTYDWQWNGPALRVLLEDPGYGIHVTWMYSASHQTSFPDRDMRYNFLDHATGAWNWTDPGFMASGVDVFTERAGYGNLALAGGRAVVSGHMGNPLRPVLAADMERGSGIFEYCDGSPEVEDFAWPCIATDGGMPVHCAGIDYNTQERLFYTAVRRWCTWDSALPLTAGNPDPGYANQNIACSGVNTRLAVTWIGHEEAPRSVYFRESTDRGITWTAAVRTPLPPAFGGDTGVTCDWMGGFPFYDRDGDLHIAVVALPIINGEVHINPVELWHWCAHNQPQWSRIHRAGCALEHQAAPIGYNGIYAGRPSLGEDEQGRLYAAWEQFDSSNYEPRTERLRADIWVGGDEGDNGQTWYEGLRITNPDSSSKRFPCIIDRCQDRAVRVRYIADQCAGFVVQGEGPATANPVLVHSVPIDVTGVADRDEGRKVRAEQGIPSVMRAPDLVRLDCRVLDAMGRDVTERKAILSPGVYFLRREVDGGGRPAVSKVVIQR